MIRSYEVYALISASRALASIALEVSMHRPDDLDRQGQTVKWEWRGSVRKLTLDDSAKPTTALTGLGNQGGRCTSCLQMNGLEEAQKSIRNLLAALSCL